jgi:hypothetical protein
MPEVVLRFLMASSMLLFSAACVAQSAIQFETLARSVIAGPMATGPRHFVALSLDEVKQHIGSFRQPWQSWEAFAQTQWGSELNALFKFADFNSRMTLGVVVRSSSTLCTGVTITSVVAMPSEILVYFAEYRPSAGTVCLASIGAAYHLVSVPQSTLPVRFSEEAANPLHGLRPRPKQ